MGLLFTYENDAAARGPTFDLGAKPYCALIERARNTEAGFPLFRRLSDFYRDTSFDLDELESLVAELRLLHSSEPQSAEALIQLATSARAAGLGLLVICD
jgi:hypothetical protein